jgi:hypothetical protein
VVSRPDSPHAQAYLAIARKVRDKLFGAGAEKRQGPKIVMQ